MRLDEDKKQTNISILNCKQIVLALIGVTFASEAAILAPAPLAYSSVFVDEPKPSYEYSTSVQTPNYNNYAHVRSGPEFERKIYNFATPIASPIFPAEPIIAEGKILPAPFLRAAPILKAAPLSAELRPAFPAFAASPISTTKLLPFAFAAKPFEQRIVPFYRFLDEKSQYHSQNSLGEATYGHREPFQSHDAVQDANGNKAGSFSYVAPDGRVLTTEYVADQAGYRVASNALPQASAPLPIAAPAAIVAEKPAEIVSDSGDSIAVEVSYSFNNLFQFFRPGIILSILDKKKNFRQNLVAAVQLHFLHPY